MYLKIDSKDYDKIKDFLNKEKIEYRLSDICKEYMTQEAEFHLDNYIEDEVDEVVALILNDKEIKASLLDEISDEFLLDSDIYDYDFMHGKVSDIVEDFIEEFVEEGE